jgi:hypothetical protein
VSNRLGGNGVYLARFFQVAYVTRDLDSAMQTFQQRYGVESFQLMRNNRVDDDTTMDIALAWVGDVMMELIQPTGAGGSFFEVMLGPEKNSTRLHHLGHLVAGRAEWDSLVDRLRRGGHPIVLQGSVEGFLSYLYVDARSETGHFIEYILCEPAGQAYFDAVPRS